MFGFGGNNNPQGGRNQGNPSFSGQVNNSPVKNERTETYTYGGETFTRRSGEIQLDSDFSLKDALKDEIFSNSGKVYRSEGISQPDPEKEMLAKAEKLRENVICEQQILGAVRDLLLGMRGTRSLRDLSSEHFNMMKDALEIRNIVEYINFLTVQVKAKNEAQAKASAPAPAPTKSFEEEDPFFEHAKTEAQQERDKLKYFENILVTLRRSGALKDIPDRTYYELMHAMSLDYTWQYIRRLNENLDAAKAEIRRLKNYR